MEKHYYGTEYSGIEFGVSLRVVWTMQLQEARRAALVSSVALFSAAK